MITPEFSGGKWEHFPVALDHKLFAAEDSLQLLDVNTGQIRTLLHGNRHGSTGSLT
jgi:hypothetical protein